MQRRFALASALAFTIVVTFALIVVGSNGGLFRHSRHSQAGAAAQASPEEIAAALQYLASAAAVPTPVTEYVYVDAPAPPPTVRYVTVPGSAQPQPQGQTQQPATGGATDPPLQSASPAAPTPRPAPTSTAIPPAPPPTSPPPAGPQGEDEFTGTVTSIDGSNVTFAHGGTQTVVRVSDGLSQLEPGMTVKVHALLLSGVWVAKEIEFGG